MRHIRLSALTRSSTGCASFRAPESSDKAEAALRTIVDIYFSPNKTIAELHEEINRDKLDRLSDFSSAAREELSTLKY
jgi:hypothetical protein